MHSTTTFIYVVRTLICVFPTAIIPIRRVVCTFTHYLFRFQPPGEEHSREQQPEAPEQAEFQARELLEPDRARARPA